jgi:ubiquinone/menaquinone biosynthesis C-methylase UbiE
MNDNNLINDFWSSNFRAKIYRRFASRQYGSMYKLLAEKITARSPKVLLDIACGGGDFLNYLSSQYNDIELHGTDIASGMVAQAKKVLSNHATILQVEGVQQPFADESFDVITITMAFHHFSDKKAVLVEVRRLLKKGGVFFDWRCCGAGSFSKESLEYSRKIVWRAWLYWALYRYGIA